MKKFEKVEKTGFISTKISLRCTPSVILGSDKGFLAYKTFYHKQLQSLKKVLKNIYFLTLELKTAFPLFFYMNLHTMKLNADHTAAAADMSLQSK